MKINNNSKYILYIILFIIFILTRINHVLSSGEIEEISFKSLAISRCMYPFGILAQTVFQDTCLPIYYFIIGILRNEIIIKIFNSILALGNVYIFVLIGKKIYNEKLGLFLGLALSINHFYLFYSGLIAPYCLNFLIYSCLINSLLDYIKKPNKRHFKSLNILNCAIILCDTFGFLYVISELIILHLLGKKKKIYNYHLMKFFNCAFVAFLVILPILIIQYALNSKFLIPRTMNGIGLNLNSIYLMLSEYFSPYLSFMSAENNTKSTLGLIYSFALNPELSNINSLKILITLFYGSILPLIISISMIIKTCLKNVKLKLLFYIGAINFGLILILMLFEKLEAQPIYTIPFFITTLIITGYGIFSLKDNFIKIILALSLILVQFINPDINSFNIKIKKNYTLLNPINNFIKENEVNKDDLLVIPYNGKFASFYFKNKTNVFDYDDKYLQISKKNGFLRNLSDKRTKRLNKKNVFYSLEDYLKERNTNIYITKYFVDNVFHKENMPKRFILVVDKLNSKPISQNSIIKFAHQNNYNPNLKKIDFRYADLSQNNSKMLFDALRSKTLYNFVNILNTNFRLDKIVEYKKLENEYYKILPKDNIFKALTSYEGDYVFLIFE